jgi:hypothetical protein
MCAYAYVRRIQMHVCKDREQDRNGAGDTGGEREIEREIVKQRENIKSEKSR